MKILRVCISYETLVGQKRQKRQICGGKGRDPNQKLLYYNTFVIHMTSCVCISHETLVQNARFVAGKNAAPTKHYLDVFVIHVCDMTQVT